MRNALMIDDRFVVTTDNSGAIGEKAQDVVQVADEVASYFSTRVTLLEQIAEGAKPVAVVLHNFSSEGSWSRYVAGIEKAFAEVGMAKPQVTGSTETNMPTLQSGLAITLIGEIVRKVTDVQQLKWFIYGEPLVGHELLAQPEKCAAMDRVYEAIAKGWVGNICPVGSKGIEVEATRLLGKNVCTATTINLQKSAGPSTAILVGVNPGYESVCEKWFAPYFVPL